MELTRCKNGHFFDGSKHSACPHCGVDIDMGQTMPLQKEDVDVPSTEYKSTSQNDSSLEDIVSSIPKSTSPDDDVKTVALYGQKIGSDPVVGWLVCVEGANKGEDYRLRSGRNFVGRAKNMDVCIPGDKAISREKHITIIYDPKKNSFLIQPGESRELAYLNDDSIYSVAEIKEYDSIQLGETKLLFVPLCGGKFTWKEEE
jgi:hypothetical protein